MLFEEKRHDFEIDGRKCFFSMGKFARKSHSAIMAGMGDTRILVSVDAGAALPEAEFFPLTVEYVEKMYAAGLISSSRFVKRERFPSDDAILKSRIIDRSIRPLFPSDYRDELLVTVEVLSFDPDSDPVILAINAVSAALLISKVPFEKAVSGVRVGITADGLIPLYKHIDRDNTSSDTFLNLVVVGDGGSFTNIDANSYEVQEEKILDAMKYALNLMNPWLEAQKTFAAMFESRKVEYTSFALPDELISDLKNKYLTEISENLRVKALNESYNKKVEATLGKIFKEYEGKYSKLQMKEAYEKIAKKELRRIIWEEGKRVDGRALDEIREIDCEASILPRAHGSGLFTRGMTQVLTIATLGTIRRQQTIEDMTGEDNRTYMHFYSQAPFALGEAGKFKYTPGRREIGHGALAEKALMPVIPSKDDFPYTIMLTSEIMSEMGSSSMGCTCASSLALMDAGVPIKKPVAGIALGLILNEENENDFKVLTDIRDLEDFYGFMDFKVAGTHDGVTAIQMDTKSSGLKIEVCEEALKQAKIAREKILECIEKVMPAPKSSLSVYAPRVRRVTIPVAKIGELIGPGGKVVKSLNEKTSTEIEIEEDGTVYIFGDKEENVEMAAKEVTSYGFVPVVGAVYEGKVVRLADFGAFVDLAPGVSGLLHVSEIKNGFVKDVRAEVKEGDIIKVKVLDVDRDGKIKLSKKAVKTEE